MPSTEDFPFRRLAVDHLVAGGSRIWWQHHRNFLDPFPHTYQLQVGHTGLADATDWVDVGSPAVNTYFLTDDQRRLYGKQLLTHYRVILTTPTHTYVSPPISVFGELTERDWLLCREIIRKETLGSKFTDNAGFLLKRLRYGVPCTLCIDPLTGEVTDSKCAQCRGVGFQTGYHTAASMRLTLDNEGIPESRGDGKVPGEHQYEEMKCRAFAFPAVALEDVWVNARDDRRWSIDTIRHVAQWRGVPLISDVTMRLIPFSDVVYRMPVGGEANDNPLLEAPGAGTGSMNVTHDYGDEDALAYKDAEGCGIAGATIMAFCKADWDAGLRTAGAAQATTTTGANGRWSFAMQLDPGDYVLRYEKLGDYGPNTQELTVGELLMVAAAAPPPPPAAAAGRLAAATRSHPADIRVATHGA